MWLDVIWVYDNHPVYGKASSRFLIGSHVISMISDWLSFRRMNWIVISYRCKSQNIKPSVLQCDHRGACEYVLLFLAGARKVSGEVYLKIYRTGGDSESWRSWSSGTVKRPRPTQGFGEAKNKSSVYRFTQNTFFSQKKIIEPEKLTQNTFFSEYI